jgi:hypothetical protein
MATKKKLLQAAAGAAGGAGLNVEEVFSTYLYNGTATNVSHQIQNGIDLAGEGGLVWIKKRDSNISNTNHHLVDTERGDYYLASNSTNAQASGSDINTFNSDGWTFDASTGLGTDYLAAQSYASWTFRKAPKFFDCVQYTGNGTAGRTVSHNLGSVPGMMIIKRTDTGAAWYVYHREMLNTDTLRLNTTAAKSTNQTNFLNSTDPTDTEFTLGSEADVNGSGGTFIAYLFAHNDGDGEFGPDGDADIIKCGSFTTDSGGNASVDIGFEPQWIIYKRSDGTSNWGMNDNMRGWADTYWNPLYADASNAESGFASTRSWPTATGFEFEGQLSASANYIYIAIRRGPMAVPEDATDVFAMDFRFSSEAQALNPEHQYYSGFPVDMHLNLRRSGGGVYAYSRLQGGSNFLRTSTTDAEVSSTTNQFGSNEGLYPLGSTNTEDTTTLGHMFRRAPNFFDVVAYTGNGTVNHQISHNLQAVPELLLFKPRGSGSWIVKSKFDDDASGVSTRNNYLLLNYINAYSTSADYRLSSNETSFTLSTNGGFDNGSDWNTSGLNYIAYLFASLDGVSKVGTFTHTDGTPTDVDCGFTSGARFVIWKKTSNIGQWVVVDTERGIVAGNDPYLELNSTNAESSAYDIIDPLSSGFTVGSVMSSGTYIFYAIA